MTAPRRKGRTFESAVLGEVIADLARDDDRWAAFKSAGLYRGTTYVGLQYEELEKAVIALRDRPQLAAVPDDSMVALDWLESGGDFFADRGTEDVSAMLVEGLIAENAGGWIAGEPKTSKTWIACELIIAVTTGRPAFGQFPCHRPGPVFYAGEEGNRARFQDRLAGLCRGYGVDLREVKKLLDVSWRQHINLTDPEWQARLLEVAPTYRWMAFDPFRDVHGCNEDSATEMVPVLDFLRQLQERGPAVLPIQHLRKSGERDKGVRTGQRIAGTRHFHSFLDSALYTKVTEGGRVRVEVEHRDHDTPPPFDFELAVDMSDEGVIFRLDLIDDADERQNQVERLVAWVAERDESPTRTDAQKYLGGRRQEAAKVVQMALESGQLRDGVSEAPDASGRRRKRNVLKPAPTAEPYTVPSTGRATDEPPPEGTQRPAVPPPVGGKGDDESRLPMADDGQEAEAERLAAKFDEGLSAPSAAKSRGASKTSTASAS